ncbi:MAG: RHS repeat-associated core domain-containing protein [Bacteroidales bacterium]|nr:RHS repeat-associated core domain-containing protein [Bacteroidales bacterium]
MQSRSSEVYRATYDAWGEQTVKKNNLWRFHRGFCMHEHWPEFGLIDMNGRMYDSVLGRFLSPDPYVQDPTFSQNFNRYSYCMNNPVRYSDPSGEKWKWWQVILGSLIVPVISPATTTTMAIDLTRTTFFKGGLDFTSSSSMRRAWHNFDPSRRGTYTNNAFRIDKGLYKTDSDQNFLRRLWYFISRTTLERPQTITGNLFSHGKNVAGCVDRVDYYGSATYCTNENSSVNGQRGVTMGNYINIDINDGLDGSFYSCMTTKHKGIYMHEYGHIFQSRNYVALYLPYIGVMSLHSAASNDDHREKLYEREASAYARRYFGDDDWNPNANYWHPTYGFLCYTE